MPVTLITTPKAENANSYVDVASADAYFATRLNAAVWTSAQSDDQARALIQACLHIEQQAEWDEEMCGARATLAQALRFPSIACLTKYRDFYYPIDSAPYPPFLRTAQCEQALFELTSDRTVDPPLRGIASVDADTVRMQTDVYADRGKGAPASQVQHVLADIVWSILAPWISNCASANGLKLVALVR